MGNLLLGLVLYVQLLVGTVATTAGARPPAMYVFGSSILDVGNNNYLPGAAVGRANRRYNGIDFPSSIPTGRFSNGYNIADYVGMYNYSCSYIPIAASMVRLCVLQQRTWGSRVARLPICRWQPSPPGLWSTPLRQWYQLCFRRSRDPGLHERRKHNPIVEAERAQNKSVTDRRRDVATLYVNLISNYSSTITELYSMGARRFALINVALQGCVPGARMLSPTGECWDSLNQLASGFNDALRSRLAGLVPRLPGLVYSLADLLGFTRDSLANPRASGYTDIVDACCGSGRPSAEAECFPNSTLCADRDQHVFWDRAHFSQRTAFLIAQAFYNGPAKYTTPINFMQLAQSS